MEKVHRLRAALVIDVQIQQGRGLVRIVPKLRLPHRRGRALGLLERDEPPAQQLHPLVPFVGERRLFQPLRRHLHALVVPVPGDEPGAARDSLAGMVDATDDGVKGGADGAGEEGAATAARLHGAVHRAAEPRHRPAPRSSPVGFPASSPSNSR